MIHILPEEQVTDPAIRVFYSYSRQDREMRDRLDEHLSHLRRSGKIVTWCDLQLEPGSEWEKTLLEKLETSDIILLLVSARFLASDYCSETELQRAIDRHNVGKAHVIPVILKPCDWDVPDVPFSKLQVLPIGAKPISSYKDNPDEAYTDVAKGIRQVVERLLDQRRKQQEAEIAAQQAEEDRQQQLEQRRRNFELERSIKIPAPKNTHTSHTSLFPWRRLALSVGGYALLGIFLVLAPAPLWLWGLILVVAWVGSLALVVAWTVTVAWAGAIILTLAVTAAPLWLWAGVGVGAVTMVVVGNTLLKSFSKGQTFLILSGVSLGGLGLGWLVGAILRLMRGTLPVG